MTAEGAASEISRAATALRLLPGLLVAGTIALACAFVAQRYGGAVLLYALLLGMALHFLAADPRVRPGIDFAAREVLRTGVALLGARITLAQVGDIGVFPVTIVFAAVVSTILASTWMARRLGLTGSVGLLTGGATAICGASAALAISSVMPKTEETRHCTLLAVVGVTGFSTLVMVLYPLLADVLRLDPRTAGIFFGGAIHDVAQVVAAGYIVSPEAGDTATVVKLFRVALLMPVVMAVSLLYRVHQQPRNAPRVPLLPMFLVAFAALVACNTAGWIPSAASGALWQASQACLVLAIAALGVKTSPRELAQLGWRPVLLMAVETLFIGAFVLIGIRA